MEFQPEKNMENLKISIEQINEILILHWDPIGISEIPECKNEYIDYAVHIWKKVQNDSHFNIFLYLRSVEAEQMNLKDMDFKHANIAASKIFELLNS
jgi:hypothetical protein